MGIASSGVFLSPVFMSALWHASGVKAHYLLVTSEVSFHLPTYWALDESLSLVQALWATSKQRVDFQALVKLIEMLFSEPAIVFSLQEYSSTDETLRAKAADCVRRISSGRLHKF